MVQSFSRVCKPAALMKFDICVFVLKMKSINIALTHNRGKEVRYCNVGALAGRQYCERKFCGLKALLNRRGVAGTSTVAIIRLKCYHQFQVGVLAGKGTAKSAGFNK